MASKGAADDPLRGGGAFDDQDMEDLTAHLANLPTGRSSHDGLGDLGDNTELQGNMDRFRALAGDDTGPDLFASFGGLGPLGLGASGPAPSSIPTTNYPTYGELAAASANRQPPSYEDSVMYEQAPLSSAAIAAVAAASGGGAAAGDPLLAPPAAPPAHKAATAGAAGGPLRHDAGLPERVGSPTPPPSGPGAGGAHHGAFHGALPDPLVLQGSGAFSDDLALSPPASQRASARPRGTSSSSFAALAISVSEPIKREGGGLFGLKAGGYVTYLVRAKHRAGARPDSAVRRRFREFVALADLLKEKYRGYFVPPRPEKNAVEGQRMTDAFVEERRLALERYLNKLARHPVIRDSEELRLFLEADCELADSPAWLALRPLSLGGSVLDGAGRFSKQILGLDRAVTDPVQAAQPTKKKTDFMRAIKETARSMQATPAGTLPPDEVSLQKGREELDALQGTLTTASRAAEKLVARLDRWAVVQGELGLALFGLRKAEQADGVALAEHTGTLKQSGGLMHDTERAGTALVRASRIGRKVTGRCAIDLGILHEYLGLMPAALKGLRAREKAMLTADTLQADLEGRRRAISDLEAAGAKVLGGDAAKAKKVADLSGDVSVLEQSIVAAKARYEDIKAINQRELSRLHGDLRSDLLSSLHSYAAVMQAASLRNTEIWLQAASELGASPEQLAEARAPLGAAGPTPAASGAHPASPSSGAGAGAGPSGAGAGPSSGSPGSGPLEAGGQGGAGGRRGQAGAHYPPFLGSPGAGAGAGGGFGAADGAQAAGIGAGGAVGAGSMGEVDLHGTGAAGASTGIGGGPL
ncbi:hypothetical protein HYH03_010040 [Edaphochlamys debaryana]|uniref:PX domain-containing protein n=1 Tax=Edaphochlamys debaryana TaxID=47281 RepID=A0A835XWV5_9CHLO|nr:hypothetical protein HYH03_010040 [Edaphochlamys debaryana]|eukprot:KAG2491671.1 hypothetical protein HYH03_010040 [Edaphochlamys debaryana]